jgi:hypothetical protein
MLIHFHRLLKATGLTEYKKYNGNGKQIRGTITFHSFRRFAKTVIADHTSTDFSEWYLGHAKSPYYLKKELDRRIAYATKCMPFLTFINYSKLEQDANKNQSDLQTLTIKDINKDREIEDLKRKVEAKDREIELLKRRDEDNTSRIDKLEEDRNDLYAHIKSGTKHNNEVASKLEQNKNTTKDLQSVAENTMKGFKSIAESLDHINKMEGQMTDKQKLLHLLKAIENAAVQIENKTNE